MDANMPLLQTFRKPTMENVRLLEEYVNKDAMAICAKGQDKIIIPAIVTMIAELPDIRYAKIHAFLLFTNSNWSIQNCYIRSYFLHLQKQKWSDNPFGEYSSKSYQFITNWYVDVTPNHIDDFNKKYCCRPRLHVDSFELIGGIQIGHCKLHWMHISSDNIKCGCKILYKRQFESFSTDFIDQRNYSGQRKLQTIEVRPLNQWCHRNEIKSN